MNHFYGAEPNVSLEFWLLPEEPEGVKLRRGRRRRRRKQHLSGVSSTWSTKTSLDQTCSISGAAAFILLHLSRISA